MARALTSAPDRLARHCIANRFRSFKHNLSAVKYGAVGYEFAFSDAHGQYKNSLRARATHAESAPFLCG